MQFFSRLYRLFCYARFACVCGSIQWYQKENVFFFPLTNSFTFFSLTDVNYAPHSNPEGNNDVYVLFLNPISLAVSHSVQLRSLSGGDEFAGKSSCDATSDFVFVAGLTTGDFGGPIPASGVDIYIVKINPLNAAPLAYGRAGSVSSPDQVYDVAVDAPTEHVYVSGATYGDIPEFGVRATPTTSTNILIVFNLDLHLLNILSVAGDDVSYIISLALDSALHTLYASVVNTNLVSPNALYTTVHQFSTISGEHISFSTPLESSPNTIEALMVDATRQSLVQLATVGPYNEENFIVSTSCTTASLVDVPATCQCPMIYNATSCEPFTECDSNPCVNGGTCAATPGFLKCTCPSHFMGTYCEDTPCDPNPCSANSTACTIVSTTFECTCDAAHTGPVCEHYACDSDCGTLGICTDFFSCDASLDGTALTYSLTGSGSRLTGLLSRTTGEDWVLQMVYVPSGVSFASSTYAYSTVYVYQVNYKYGIYQSDEQPLVLSSSIPADVAYCEPTGYNYVLVQDLSGVWSGHIVTHDETQQRDTTTQLYGKIS